MKLLFTTLSLAALAVAATPALASATVGQPAPAFSATDTTGRTVQLADFKGRHVVLEWVNPGCPYVRKHYGAKNMQATQKGAVDAGASGGSPPVGMLALASIVRMPVGGR